MYSVFIYVVLSLFVFSLFSVICFSFFIYLLSILFFRFGFYDLVCFEYVIFFLYCYVCYLLCCLCSRSHFTLFVAVFVLLDRVRGLVLLMLCLFVELLLLYLFLLFWSHSHTYYVWACSFFYYFPTICSLIIRIQHSLLFGNYEFNIFNVH